MQAIKCRRDVVALQKKLINLSYLYIML